MSHFRVRLKLGPGPGIPAIPFGDHLMCSTHSVPQNWLVCGAPNRVAQTEGSTCSSMWCQSGRQPGLLGSYRFSMSAPDNQTIPHQKPQPHPIHFISFHDMSVPFLQFLSCFLFDHLRPFSRAETCIAWVSFGQMVIFWCLARRPRFRNLE